MGCGKECPHRKPLISLLPGDTVQYGKRVSDLQSGITIDRDRVFHGTLHFVKDYEKFDSMHKELQSGNYIAMQLPDTETCEITGSSGTRSLPKDDRQLVWRVKGQDATLKVKTEEREETYSASGLTLEQDPDAAAAAAHILAAGTRLDVQVGKDTTQAADASESDLDGLMALTKKELQAMAEARGLTVPKTATKADLVDLLQE